MERALEIFTPLRIFMPGRYYRDSRVSCPSSNFHRECVKYNYLTGTPTPPLDRYTSKWLYIVAGD
jgi:hypothetical protein